jgi:hypothetical protein
MQNRYPRQVMRDKSKRGMVMTYVSPSDEAMITCAADGMSRRLGTDVTKSWALSHTHISYMDAYLDRSFNSCVDPIQRHELACAGTINLLAYLGWLRGGEVFGGKESDFTITAPHEGPTRGLPPGIGAVEFQLLPETKSDATLTADVVIAFTTLSGLSLGTWLARLSTFTPYLGEQIFSTATTPTWTSAHFRRHFAIPILEVMRLSGEPTLRAFSNDIGQRLEDKIVSMHSWRRGGRSRVSRPPRHNEPNPPGTRKAKKDEIYEHGRWAVKATAENMPRRYNQWDLMERISITLHCM